MAGLYNETTDIMLVVVSFRSSSGCRTIEPLRYYGGREEVCERELLVRAGVRDTERPRLGVSFSSVRGSRKRSPMWHGVPFVMGLRAGRSPSL